MHEPQSGGTGMQPQTSAFGGRQLAGRGEHFCVSTNPFVSSQNSRPILHIWLGPHGNVLGPPLLEVAPDPVLPVEAALDPLLLVEPAPDPVADEAVDPAPDPVGPDAALLVAAAAPDPPAPADACESTTLLPQDVIAPAHCAMAAPTKTRLMDRMAPS
jgi:hypothetical protein